MRRLVALTIAIAVPAVWVPTASAGVTLGVSGNSIVLAGDATSNETYIDYSGGTLSVLNQDANVDGITLAAGAFPTCGYDPANSQDKIVCNGAVIDDIQATYVAGNDLFRFVTACVASATIALGEGTNTYNGQACPSSTITVTGGSGQDTLSGSDDGGATRDVLDGAGGDDTIHGGSGDDVIHGGEGKDYITGFTGNDQLFGDGGDDKILAGAGNDVENGGAGDDVVGQTLGLYNDDDQGADDVRGGDGTDKLLLGNHSGGMAISLDDQPNDGSAGEGDNLHSDFEKVEGTKANDTYTGSAGADEFDGNSGADVVHGAGGADRLFGGSDADQVFGDEGNDTVYGDYGDDVVDGGPGTDSVFGDLANCSSFSCPAYNDRILARDGEQDQIQCGAGADTVVADTLDVVAVDGFQACESVDRAVSKQGTVPGAFSFAAARRFSRARGAAVKVTCDGACTISVRLTIDAKVARRARLGRKAMTVGSARATLAAAGTTNVTVRLTRKARRRMARLESVKARLALAVVDGAGATTRKQQTITLRR